VFSVLLTAVFPVPTTVPDTQLKSEGRKEDSHLKTLGEIPRQRNLPVEDPERTLRFGLL
jgi:hypothetical protein